MKRQRRLACLALTAVLVAACGSAGSGDLAFAADVTRASASPADAVTAGSSIDAFGLDLLAQVETGTGNVVVSPASVAIALAMARAGASGATATQMDAVLHGIGGPGINALDQALAARSGTFTDAAGVALPVTLQIANAPFAQHGLALLPGYLDALAADFGAGVRLVDYQADPEAARQTINAWVKTQTEGRIPQLLGAGTVTPATRLTLVDAIYLKAPWATAFPAQATAPAPFTRADGSTVSVATMSLSTSLGYAAGAGWRAVELPYVGGSLALTVILPDDLATFEAGLTPQVLAQVTSALAPREVDLSLPKFSIETATSLAAALKAMGMPLAFDPDQADFSGMTTQERLFISDVIHQADIAVDEKGTEAAAASAVVMAGTAAPAEPVTVRVDRPFLFALRDLPTGAVLFLGRVTDPSAK